MNRDQKLFAVSATFFIVTCLIAALILSQRSAQLPVPGEVSTTTMVANPAPSAVTLDLQQQLNTCVDYSPERRNQMQQHITWLQDPAQIPADLRPAFNPNPLGKLLFGMATYTSIEWRLRDRPAGSCLLLLGRKLNALAVEYGESPVEGFEE
jgi:hypothetical protein